VTFATTSGRLTDSANLLYSGTDLNVYGLTVGRGAGAVSTNTAVGASALAGSNTGGFTTAVGYQAGISNTSGQNTLVGANSGQYITTGTRNTGVGVSTLGFNNGAVSITSNDNTGYGHASLTALTSGAYNTALGSGALQSNNTGPNNTAVGYQAGNTNQSGDRNTFLGFSAGWSQTNSFNTFVGARAGYLSTGERNTFVGAVSNIPSVANYGCGELMTTGSKNTILGGFNGNQNALDIRATDGNIVISDGDGVPYLFFKSGAGQSWYFGTLAAGAGTNALKWNTTSGIITYDTSSARYKDNIRDSIYGLSHVMQMRSAQFEYKDTGRSDVGLIAEELDPIIPELVMKNKDGEPDAVSYDRMVSVLVKAIQELKAEFDAYKASHP
jgi:hypothetical protein